MTDEGTPARGSLAARLATLYTVLLGVTLIVVIAASSLALVLELAGFSHDVVIAKHEEARFLAAEMREEGLTFAQAAPRLASALSGIGLQVAVYDDHGRFLAGDRSVHPHVLDRIVSGKVSLAGPRFARGRGVTERAPHIEPFVLAAVEGGYVAFQPSLPLLFVALVPYWRVVSIIAIAAIVLSWFVGRIFAVQTLRPLSEVTESLRALAAGDYTQRRFVTAGGDEIAALTAAYNDAATSVGAAIDERRRTEERMRRFVADAGHELRTPLTVLGGYLDVLRRGAVDEPRVARQILATMSLEREHMRSLIDRLVRLARMDDEEPPARDEIEIADLLRRQCEAAHRLDESREIDYSIDGVERIVGDRTELSEALWNVVENALKYAPDAPIHLRAVRAGSEVVISVADEGPGMTESERLHAFERFYRGERRGEIAGTGLGLAIARRAVERAGGSIAIDSAPGHGTTVHIRLPLSGGDGGA